MDLAGRVLAGRYRLLAAVGVGASAHVYVADDVQLRRRVAVKVLHPGLAGDPTFLRRFQAEAQAAAALNHPNVVAVYDWGRDDAAGAGEAVPFLVTEYLEGGTLRGMLDGEGPDRAGPEGGEPDGEAGNPLTLSQTLLVGLEVCRGLHYAHHRGFVHRDIKPANLLFGEDRRLRIADFGLARALAEASWTEPEGVVLGTVRYVSPEQAAGMTVDTRSDLYSLALVLVECVTGQVPHTMDTTIGTLRARMGRDIEVEEARFGPLATLIEGAGRADPAARFTAAQLGAALMGAAQALAPPEPLALAPPQFLEPRAGGDRATRLFVGDQPLVVVADPQSQAVAGDLSADAPRPAAPAPAAQSTPAAQAGPAPAASAPDGGVRSALSVERRGRPRRRKLRVWPLLATLLVVSAVVLLAVLSLRLAGGGSAQSPPISQPARFVVDRYVGRDLTDVERELERAGYGWRVEVATERRDGTGADEILAQDPAPGTELAEGDTLRVVRSLGATLVKVPNPLGKLIEDPAVLQAFTEATLLVDRQPRFDETKPLGEILAVVGADREVEKRSRVTVVVSAGPEPRTLLDYVTTPKKLEVVKAELATASIIVDVTEQASETVEQGYVISTNPPAGGQVAKGGTVTVVVSSGLPYLTVPDLRGMTGRDAEDLLAAQGWQVKSIVGPSSATVIGTDPEAGVQRRKGSPISIITRSN